MRLILVRHGETACNIDEIWHGWDECELTALGLAQAEAVARRLSDERLDVLYSSPSRRAMQTAQAIGRSHGLEPIPDAGLRERGAGDYEGIAVDAVVAANPRIWEDRAADYWNWRPPGGESFQQVLDRALETIERIRAEYPRKTVAAVTHMGVVRVLMSHFAGIPLAETYTMEFPSTGISVFRWDAGAVEVELLNDAAHVGS